MGVRRNVVTAMSFCWINVATFMCVSVALEHPKARKPAVADDGGHRRVQLARQPEELKRYGGGKQPPI